MGITDDLLAAVVAHILTPYPLTGGLPGEPTDFRYKMTAADLVALAVMRQYELQARTGG